MKISYKNVTFVIPTNRDKVYTIDSIPSDSPVYIEREGSLNQARNRGVRKAETDLIIVCDDDIRFNREFLDLVFSKLSRNTLVGLEDYYAMRWCIGRFMCFWKKDWESIAGFDESRTKYGGDDTDFCIRMEKNGVEIRSIPRNSVEHIYEEKDHPTIDVMEPMFYLLRKHPRQMIIPCIKLTLRKRGLIGDKNE